MIKSIIQVILGGVFISVYVVWCKNTINEFKNVKKRTKIFFWLFHFITLVLFIMIWGGIWK